MKVSIITIVLNGQSLIARTIDSVLAQDYTEIEYIVLDGASTDGTLEVIAGYGDKITRFVSEPDKGISNAWNKALKMATGEVIGLLNAGDEYAPEAVSQAVKEIEAGADFTYGDTVLVNELGQALRFNRGRLHLWKYSGGIGFYHPSCFAKRQLYESIGGFDEKLRYAMDTDFILRAMQAGFHIRHCPTTVRMLDGGVSVSSRFLAYGEYLQSMHRNKVGMKYIYLSMIMTGARGLVRTLVGRRK